MAAIAEQLSRLSETGEHGGPSRQQIRDGRGEASGPPRPNPRASLRDAVAEIARRQADLDGRGALPVEPRAATPPSPTSREGTPPWSRAAVDPPFSDLHRANAGQRRGGAGLSSEVSETFARFSRDLHDAIQATDARPQVEALDRQVRQIGRAVGDFDPGRSAADAITRIGEQTREMRDLLKATSDRSVPFDTVERHVASLESRLGRLAALPPSPHDPGATLAEVRALLDGIEPRAMASLGTRLDDITTRIERGLDAPKPAELIEGLSRRVDEIHASLRSQLAESAVDTRPLEGLVRGLSDRIGQTRTASADIQQLEIAMRDVAAKIDGVGSGVDARGVQAVEAQLARLADRLDRSEVSLKALDGVEHSLGELFSQFEVTRQVAIDAAETAARTAARDTLRAALQNPGLAPRPADMPSGFADQVVRGLDDLRSLQETTERRTQAALSDIRAAMERLALRLAADAAEEPRGLDRAPAREPRHRRAAASDASRVEIDPADMLIEPGAGRAAALSPTRVEPAVPTPEPAADEAPSSAAALDGDGPSSFIAAARRAAQAAQASAAATAALKATDRRPVSRDAGPRQAGDAAVAGTGTMARVSTLLRQRRRPILLGLAALVLLVGALEVVRIGGGPVVASRTGDTDAGSLNRTHVAALAIPAPAPPAALPSQPVAAAPLPALPTFVAGVAKPQGSTEGIGEGLRSLANAGDAAAQYEVGLRYAEGRGVARDPKQATGWFEKAAAQGSAPAEYRLGSAYEKGVGADRDPALAMSWYGKAADAGNIRAMHNLAVMSAEGAAGKPDYAKAAQWFAKASSFGVRDSQFNLAILYARGLGIEQSLAQSYTWFAIAAGEGDDDAAKKRDEVATKLDAKALASAKAGAEAYRAGTPVSAANEVAPPPGGWDALAPRAPGASTPAAKVSQL